MSDKRRTAKGKKRSEVGFKELPDTSVKKRTEKAENGQQTEEPSSPDATTGCGTMAERSTKGRFLPGNSGGPGRPKKITRVPEADYIKATIDTVTVERWRVIVQTAVTQAEAGDSKARDFLAKFLLGQDPATVTELMEQLQTELERVRTYAKNLEHQSTTPPGRSETDTPGPSADPPRPDTPEATGDGEPSGPGDSDGDESASGDAMF